MGSIRSNSDYKRFRLVTVVKFYVYLSLAAQASGLHTVYTIDDLHSRPMDQDGGEPLIGLRQHLSVCAVGSRQAR
ncbi:hypothetical protein [Spongiactinospora rosea]|nr:hypothetical protein [Spongiactinospora rosea]